MTISPGTIARELLGNINGHTIWLSSEESTGYVVGGASETLKVVSPIFVATIVHWVSDRLAEWIRDNSRFATLGVWRDNGITYFDAGNVLFDRWNAICVARERGELVIWDIANACEIDVR